jgi:hypothetical protein
VRKIALPTSSSASKLSVRRRKKRAARNGKRLFSFGVLYERNMNAKQLLAGGVMEAEVGVARGREATPWTVMIRKRRHRRVANPPVFCSCIPPPIAMI